MRPVLDPAIPNHRDTKTASRRDIECLSRHIDPKLTAPSFAGHVNPEAYLDWERRLDNIKKISFAAAQLIEGALTLWDREVVHHRQHPSGKINNWEEMKRLMCRRYVPVYYHCELQEKFRKLNQGTKSVEEYFVEFELLKNRLEIEDSEEALMVQFIDGLHEWIAAKVERNPYHDLQEVLHLVIQAEQHNNRKTTAKPKAACTAPKPVEAAPKKLEIKSRFRKSITDPPSLLRYQKLWIHHVHVTLLVSGAKATDMGPEIVLIWR